MPGDYEELLERYPYHRRFIRIKLRLRVLVGASRPLQSWTQNVSADGLCFEIPQRLQPEDKVEVWLYPPQGEGSPIRARCRVVWFGPAARGFRHGAQFMEFFEDGRERLLKILEALMRPPTQPPPP